MKGIDAVRPLEPVLPNPAMPPKAESPQLTAGDQEPELDLVIDYSRTLRMPPQLG